MTDTSNDQGGPAVAETEETGTPVRTVDGLERVELAGGGTLWHADTERMARMSHTIVGTEVPGLLYAIGVGAEGDGVAVREVDYRAAITEQEGPAYVDSTRTVRTVRSFLEEIRRRPLDPTCSTLTSHERAGEVVAVYDDHTAGMVRNLVGERRPGRRLDRLRLALEQDPDWAAWLAIDGRALTQEAFGDAIEERLHTIIEPDQADLLAVIDNLRVTSAGHFESRISRANGSQVLEMHDEHKVSAGQLTVPEMIRFAVPIYDGNPVRYELAAWFRVRVDRGAVTLHVKLKPYRQTVVAAWRDVLNDIERGLGEVLPDSDASRFAILDA